MTQGHDSDPECAEIKRGLKCWEAAVRLGLVEGKRRHGWRHFQCVAHDDSNPSMGCNDDTWSCLSCGASGSVFNLIMRAHGVDFLTAKRTAAEWAGVDLGQSKASRAELKARDTERAAKDYERKEAARAKREKEREVRSLVMSKIWKATQYAAHYSPAVSRYLSNRESGRGIDPSVAHNLGCRDWFTVGDALRKAIAETSEADQLTAGLRGISAKGDSYLWQPLSAAIEGQDHRRAGLAVPIWEPGTDHPMAYRWRYVTPWTRGKGEPLKCAAQPSAHLAYKVPQVLGVGLPPVVDNFPPTHYPNGEPIPDDVRPRRKVNEWFTNPPKELWCATTTPLAATSPVVFVTEGEPDWLSVSECVGDRAAVIGIAANPSAKVLLDVLRRALGSAHYVVVLAHRAKGKRNNGETSDVTTFESVRAAVSQTVTVRLEPFHEKDDCNDYHRRGKLAPLIDEFLGRIE